MARLIVCAGNKGGAGKSLVSHAIAHGPALHGVSVFHISTDIGREIPNADTRRYATMDGRRPRQLGRLVDKLATMPRSAWSISTAGRATRWWSS
jgi:chromosome partitioning protein